MVKTFFESSLNGFALFCHMIWSIVKNYKHNANRATLHCAYLFVQFCALISKSRLFI